MAALKAFGAFYNSNFDKRPVATLVITNGVLFSIADALAQASTTLMKTRSTAAVFEQYEPARTLRFCVFGMGMGPIIGRWMRILERRIPIKAGETKGTTVQLAKRVLADQLIMAPFGLVLFVGSMGLMEGRDTAGIQAKFTDMFFPALFANWKVWPLIQTVNFKLMPIQYRVPFQSTCGIAWTLYLSLLNADDDEKTGNVS